MKLSKALTTIGLGLIAIVAIGIAISLVTNIVSFVFNLIYGFLCTPWALIVLIGAVLFVAGKILKKRETATSSQEVKVIAESE